MTAVAPVPIVELSHAFSQMTLKQPGLSAEAVAITMQYLPLEEVESRLVALTEHFGATSTLRTQALAYRGREAEKLELEILEWIGREKKSKKEIRFRPTPPIREGLLETRHLDGFALFFDKCSGMPLRRIVHAIHECCPKLQSINLTGCRQIGVRVMQHLSKFKELTTLRLGHCPELHADQMAPLASTTSLQHLELQGSALTDADLTTLLHPLKKLTYLNLNGCRKITSDGVRALFANLPSLAKVELAGNTQRFPWQMLCESVVTLSTGFAGPFITNDFFQTTLGQEAIQHAASFALARGIKKNGRTHLSERIKDSKGYCRGHSYALIIAHCKMTHAGAEKYCLIAAKVHIQFFQALEYLIRPHTDKEKALVTKVEKTSRERLRELAGIKNEECLHMFTYSAPTFWQDFTDVIRKDTAHIVEIVLRSSSNQSAHSIVLFFKPKFIVADLMHGIGEYSNRTLLEHHLADYFKNFGTKEDPLGTVEVMTLQNRN